MNGDNSAPQAEKWDVKFGGEELSPAPGSVSTPLTDSGVGNLPFPRPYLSM